MEEIIIIGGGLAGLMAANELSKKGFGVVILEAAEKLGGRIRTTHDKKFAKPAEKGAEFIHGDLPLTMELLKKAKLNYKPVKGKMFRVENGEWEEQTEFAEGWYELIEEMNEVRQDLPFKDFLEKNFGAEKYAELKKTATRFAEGFDVADINKVSTLALRAEWMEEDDQQYRMTGGFDQMVDRLADECSNNGAGILTSQKVEKIKWKKNNVEITTADGISFIANKVIITIPLGVLQSDPPTINFQPAIKNYFAAAKRIGFGNVVKVLLQFKEPFWEKKKKNIGFIFSGEKIPTWWTQAEINKNLLTGWAGGGQAVKIDKSTDKELLDIALRSLSNIFQMNIDEIGILLTAATISNWKNDPLTRGAYSFATVQSVEAKRLLNTPIDETIFFAGEALYDGSSPGTIEAALVSGKNIAEQLLNKP